ncbi:MAG TPA: C40 family peptidase [Alcanivoracaceae bacterium]|nr:C40 family peptidase [Alcanivoracaceae bacterium]
MLITAAAFTAACATAPMPQQQTSSFQRNSIGHNLEPLFEDSYSEIQLGGIDDVLFHAISLMGIPYKWGGTTPDEGFDCSGLIRYVFDESAGVRLPRTTAQMISAPAPNVKRSRLQSGDVVFFATNGGRRVSHAGIYVGEGRFIHAPSTGSSVRIDKLENPYWSSAYISAKRFLD